MNDAVFYKQKLQSNKQAKQDNLKLTDLTVKPSGSVWQSGVCNLCCCLTVQSSVGSHQLEKADQRRQNTS